MKKERKVEMLNLTKSLNIEMNDYKLLDVALTHTSYAHESKSHPKPIHNERLEFLGDSVLSLIVTTYMYKNYPKMNEGSLTKLRAYLVCEDSLATYSKKIGIGKYLKLGKGEVISGGRERESILADAFEAVLGAYYIDQGLDKATEYLLNMMIDELKQVAEVGVWKDYKTRLQEIVQKEGSVEIVYELQSEHGPDHEKLFDTAVLVNGELLGTGTGKSKKEAEQNAAQLAIDSIEKK